MYLEAHLIPTENNTKDEWIINLHLQDGTKIEAKIIHGYKQTVAECKDDIKHSKKLVRLRIRQEFGNRPESVSIHTSCVMES